MSESEQSPSGSREPSPGVPTGPGNTTASRDGRTPAPRLPHERDESASEQGAGEASQKSVGEIALSDARSEKTNTDRSAEADATYNRNFERSDAEPPRR